MCTNKLNLNILKLLMSGEHIKFNMVQGNLKKGNY